MSVSRFSMLRVGQTAQRRRRDPEAARAAMRIHLVNSRERLRWRMRSRSGGTLGPGPDAATIALVPDHQAPGQIRNQL